MVFGYTLSDTANDGVFMDAAEFIVQSLKYSPAGECLQDVDGSLIQKFESGTNNIELESNVQIDYVAIKSNTKLPIKCLHTWVD